MTKDETLRMALEALEAMQMYAEAERKGLRICDEAITAIKQALAAPVQEPLSRETVMQMAHDVGFDLDPTRNMLIEVRGQHAQLINLARSIEAAHGITKRK